MFKLLGVIVLGYTVYGAMQGELHAKSGIRWRIVQKTESPGYFWAVFGCYLLLGLALIFVF